MIYYDRIDLCIVMTGNQCIRLPVITMQNKF